MTPLAQQTAIARLAGYTVIQINDGVPAGQLHGQGMFTPLPDYLGSRDAIVPVIEKLWRKRELDWSAFAKLLEDIHGEPCQLIEAATTEPEQLCEIALRLVGKWDDSA